MQQHEGALAMSRKLCSYNDCRAGVHNPNSMLALSVRCNQYKWNIAYLGCTLKYTELSFTDQALLLLLLTIMPQPGWYELMSTWLGGCSPNRASWLCMRCPSCSSQRGIAAGMRPLGCTVPPWFCSRLPDSCAQAIGRSRCMMGR